MMEACDNRVMPSLIHNVAFGNVVIIMGHDLHFSGKKRGIISTCDYDESSQPAGVDGALNSLQKFGPLNDPP